MPLYPQGKSPWYPLDRRLDGPQSRSGRGGEEKNYQPLLGLEPPTIQPVAQRCTIGLSRVPFETLQDAEISKTDARLNFEPKINCFAYALKKRRN
jgi:hypothetical protein